MQETNVPQEVITCRICEDVYTVGTERYCFKVPAISTYEPYAYLKGCQTPEILIIAINPRGPIGTVHEKTKDDLINFKPSGEKQAQRFYSKYKGISQSMYNNWDSNESVVAETDLFKCFSPNVDNNIKDQLIRNCFHYLEGQVKTLSNNLKLIICNGVLVSNTIKKKYKDNLSDLVVPYNDINFSYSNFKIGYDDDKSLDAVIVFIPFLSGRFPLKKEKVEKVKYIIENDILLKKFPELSKKLKLKSYQLPTPKSEKEASPTTVKTPFETIQEHYELPEYLKTICSNISEGNANLDLINKTLHDNNINVSVAKADFIQLIFEFIKLAFEDNILTVEEKNYIIYLKRLFHIKHGDFYVHSNGFIEQIIDYQLTKIYEDSFVTPQEALLKVDLQELFDLSFDQMNEYTKPKARTPIHQGANPIDLDVFFTNDEYFILKKGAVS